MTSVSLSFTALLPPEKIWRALTDFDRWGGYLVLEDAKEKGWGNRWQAQGQPGPGMKLSVYFDQALMQEWAVEDWSPPKRLKLSSTAWHGSRPYAMRSSLEFTLSAASPVETKVDMVLETEFSHPIFGVIFKIVPLKKEFSRVLARFERGLVAALA